MHLFEIQTKLCLVSLDSDMVSKYIYNKSLIVCTYYKVLAGQIGYVFIYI